MPISGRLVARSALLLLTIGFSALFLIVGVNVWLSERAQNFFQASTSERLKQASAVELRDALRTAESSQRGFLLTGNEIYLAPYNTAKAQAQRQLAILSDDIKDERELAPMLDRLSNVVSQKILEMDQSISLKTEGRDDEALSIIQSNRGKALTDEANVFLYGVILSANERLVQGGEEQRRNIAFSRSASVAGAVVIVIVIGIVVVTVTRYTREIAQARDQVNALNATLEERVERRTADLALARQHAEALLTEVNHRVANSLQLVAALVKLQSGSVRDEAARKALEETQTRILAVALVHKRLYNANDVGAVSLREYLGSLLEHLETSMRSEGRTAYVKHTIEDIRFPTDATISLGVILSEWVTNAFKYAYPELPGEIRVRVSELPDGYIEVAVEDNGVGKREGLPVQGTGLGTKIVSTMATKLKARIENRQSARGTAMRLLLPKLS